MGLEELEAAVPGHVGREKAETWGPCCAPRRPRAPRGDAGCTGGRPGSMLRSGGPAAHLQRTPPAGAGALRGEGAAAQPPAADPLRSLPRGLMERSPRQEWAAGPGRSELRIRVTRGAVYKQSSFPTSGHRCAQNAPR